MLTHTNDEVRELNEAARDRMRAAGELGDDMRVKVERGTRAFATGDRLMFLKNERGLGVKNGTLGAIEQVNERSMTVRTDAGRAVSFDLKDYAHVDHGYAATLHKAQGMTVDRVHVLATPGMDSHGAYVGLSRHRDGAELHYGRDDFKDEARLVRTLSRDRAKDMASDYERLDPARDYAERRGITFRERVERVVEIVKQAPEKVRGIFDGLRLPANGTLGLERAAPERKVAEDPEEALRRARTRALVRHARAVNAIFETQEQGGRASPEQVKELQEARKVFEEVRPYGSHDAEAAYKKNPELAQEAATGRVNRAVRALQLETEMRTDPQRRADRFVDRWRELGQASQRQYQAGDMAGYKVTRSAMGDMAKSLERDPQLESILANRKKDLGIGIESGRRLGLELAFNHGIDLGRGRSIGV
ncbi:hypothetical protein [Acidocella sp.]|uniref:hypothetical protein n=1 Tax=Acidocella sp. TaxID=50710 RepID=UPI0026232FBF|nr:hypothetical protein [Acidocella sp.]